ncbi:hypothetical protein VU13_04900, partial [Desulfobulbus sp. US5]|nr:hypothetical protein [Desulfobulbus sp. US5]
GFGRHASFCRSQFRMNKSGHGGEGLCKGGRGRAARQVRADHMHLIILDSRYGKALPLLFSS